MALKDAALVASTAAVASGGTYVIQNGSSTESEPTAEEAKKKNSVESKETKPEVFDSVIVEQVSDVFEGVSQYRFAVANATKDKVLIPWDEIDTWVQKVDANVVKKEVWLGDLIFWANRSSKNYARQLRQKCYQAADYLTRVAFGDDQSKTPKENLFKTVDNRYNDSQLITLCAKDGQTYSETEKAKFNGSNWMTLNSYLNGKPGYTFASQAPEDNQAAKDFHEKRKKEVQDEGFEESMKKYSVYVIKQTGKEDKFASKENFGIVYDKLEDIPFLKGVLTKNK